MFKDIFSGISSKISKQQLLVLKFVLIFVYHVEQALIDHIEIKIHKGTRIHGFVNCAVSINQTDYAVVVSLE
jgi:hypothetical protein